ncbi:MAG: class II fructose-bisphosphate aldolase family protein [Christensenellaceae bacterium]|jgi:fructose-bisphosphate aldolase class II|nr:class II fructose-bisphosphate aldolase family protein [Christensenellaceae bacterium]
MNEFKLAFNVNNLEFIKAITEAADELGVPIILQASKGAIRYMGLPYIVALINSARSQVKVPITLHLDHGANFEICKECIDAGFDSVMIDGSDLPLNENIALTKKVCEYAHLKGVKVEGELGAIDGIEDEKSGSLNYTDPAEVLKFANETRVDSLAVSIGTVHGAFKYKTENPELRLDILKKINELVPDLPLVLHGASSVLQNEIAIINANGGEIKGALGISEEKLAETKKFGVKKINIDSDLRLAFTAGVREYISANPSEFDPRKYLGAGMARVKAVVKNKIKIFYGV